MWSQNEYLLASLIDAQREANWMKANTGVERAKQSPRPEPVERPADLRKADERAKKAAANALKFRARFGARRPPKE